MQTEKLFAKGHWPILHQFLALGGLSYVDCALAELLLKDYPEANEKCAAFICYLSAAARQGHLCVRVVEKNIYPDPFLFWSDSNISSDIGELTKTLSEMIMEGALLIPKELITNYSATDSYFPSTPICKQGDNFYLQRYWVYETLFLQHLHNLEQSNPSLSLDVNILRKQVQEAEKDKILLTEQGKAILNIATENLTLICGGPGTGKTYTAGQLIKFFWSSLSEEQRQKCRIALAAPTGKAAANLQKSLAKVVNDLKDFKLSKAQTLHALLNIRGPQWTVQKLTADLIIVDESSMIDVRLMTCLLAAVKPGARLVLLGDPHQLPPVEAGSLFADLIAYRKTSSNQQQHPIELKKCLRAELQGIIDFADSINAGDVNRTLGFLSNRESCGVSRVQLSEQDLIEYACPYFPSTDHFDEHNPQKILEAFNQFRLLSPLRKGSFGVDELNRLFLKQMIKKISRGVFIAPIMLVNNDARLELFNGEVGILVRRNRFSSDFQDLQCQEGDYALFPSKNQSDCEARKFPALLLPKFEYAYCLSVHKSQGSEFDHVLLLMPEGAQVFGREVLYTAATRAKKKLEILGDDEILKETIQRCSHRFSGVLPRLKKED